MEQSDAFREIGDEGSTPCEPESGVAKIPVTEATEQPYFCRRCKRAFEVRYHVCPDCDGYDIQRREWCMPTDGCGDSLESEIGH